MNVITDYNVWSSLVASEIGELDGDNWEDYLPDGVSVDWFESGMTPKQAMEKWHTLVE